MTGWTAPNPSVDCHAPKAYSAIMFTVVETVLFQKQWPLYWSEEERAEFAVYLARASQAAFVSSTSSKTQTRKLFFSRSTPRPRPTTWPGLYSRRFAVPSNSKPLSAKELAAFESKRDLAAEILQSIREMKAGKTNVVFSPATEAREKTGLSQSQFAALLGVSVRTLQGWEQGRKQPSGAARTLLTIARTNPKALLAVAGK